MTEGTSGRSATPATAGGRRSTVRAGAADATSRSATIHRILNDVRRAERIRVTRAWLFLLLAVALGVGGAHLVAWLLS